MAKIFISYRRLDSRVDARSVYRELVSIFGKQAVFMDLTNIEIGTVFSEVIKTTIQQCMVCLVIIGKQWVDIKDDAGNRRLDNPEDLVRLEVTMALDRFGRGECEVIPILVSGAPMPKTHQLPDDMKKLTAINVHTIRDDITDFEVDIARLVDKLKLIIGKLAPKREPDAPLPDVNTLIKHYRVMQKSLTPDAPLTDWYRARDLLIQIRASEAIPDIFATGIDHYERQVAESIAHIEATIARAFRTFRWRYPDPAHDLDNLRLLYGRADEILPQPFAWCEIPEGKVTLIPDDTDKEESYLKEDTTFTVPTFHMAKYPVTNAQYDLFVGHPDGYRNPAWWDYSPDARQWRANKLQSIETYFAGVELPRTHVSWYDGVAFCRWISVLTGENITLPTEQQWQRAAQGDDGRVYPWGNDWDGARCNHSVSPFDSHYTTPVTQFQGKDKGDSPYGVVDMTGNVWEWCLTAYETGKTELIGTGVRVLRGGSWDGNDSDYFRAVGRYRFSPRYRLNFVGFRFARF